MPNFITTAGGYKFIQNRLDTRDWWLMPVVTLESAAFVYDLVNRFYRGDDKLLVDVVLVHNPTPDLAFMFLVLASKTCLSKSQFGQLIEREGPNADLLVHGTTPLSALNWLKAHFRFHTEEAN
jgi:hypothetical protein